MFLGRIEGGSNTMLTPGFPAQRGVAAVLAMGFSLAEIQVAGQAL
jgi:hypothetical protein